MRALRDSKSRFEHAAAWSYKYLVITAVVMVMIIIMTKVDGLTFSGGSLGPAGGKEDTAVMGEWALDGLRPAWLVQTTAAEMGYSTLRDRCYL